jgi:tetratricopeptide (TPR) repeat protein
MLWLALGLTLAAIALLLYWQLARRDSDLQTRSLPELKRLAASPESDPLIHVALGEKLARTNQPAAALQEFYLAARMLEPGQHDLMAEQVFARLGFATAYLGDSSTARTYIDRAKHIKPDDWLVSLGEGTLAIHQQDLRKAIDLTRHAVEKRPNSYEAHYILGLAYNDNKDVLSAERELNRSVALAPEFAAAKAELGHAYAYQMQYSTAAEQFRAARKLDPESRDYLFALGEALGKSARTPHQYEEAVAAQEDCVQASPNNANLLFTLGQLHLRFLKLDSAIRALRRSAELRPQHGKTWYNLARALELNGEPQAAAEAMSRFERLLALHDATTYHEKQVAAHPTSAALRMQLARSFQSEGNLRGCFAQLKAALALEPGSIQAQMEMARLQSQFQRMLDQQGGEAAKREVDNPTGPPVPGTDSP